MIGPCRLLAIAVLVPVLLGAGAVAPPAAAQSFRERNALQAVLIEKPPRIDGVLDDESWQAAGPVDTFTQQEPHLGEPASERTEVRVTYDSRHLYISVHAYDSVPSMIVSTEMRRDADRLLDEDNFQIILDTFNDSRNGYMFVTTPLGAKLEQQIFDEGEGGGRGATSNVNRNWDGVWDAAARRVDDGWTAEISIPTTTLRFAPGDEQTWGINFMRNIRHKNEQVYWAPIPKAYGLTRVSLAGQLNGLRSLNQGMDLKLKPFVVAGARDNRLVLGAPLGTSAIHSIGLDAKYGVTAGLNLDLTLNTDFAQVEADEQQVNLTRFSLFFPEKRDFFLENSNLFSVGTGQSFTSTPVQTDLFFSRKIGLSATGQPVPIIGGARLTGKAGKNNLAFLDIQTEEYLNRPGDNFLVTRYSRDVLSRSRVGAIFVNKESAQGSDHYNRTMGVDANMAVGRNMQINSFLAKTATPGLDGKDMSFYGRVAYRDPMWNVWLNYLDVQDNFNAEAGFVQRRGVKTTKGYFSPTPRPGKANIKVMEPMFVLTYVTDQQNRMIGRTQHFMVGTTMQDDSFINVIYQRNLDVLDVPFLIQPGIRIPIGSYSFDEWSFTYNTSPARRFYERFTFQPMEFYDGTRTNAAGTVGVRATNRLSSELQFSRNDVNLPWGDFVVNLAILRVDYTFSPRMTIRTLTQYNSMTHEVTASVRYNFIHRPGSDLYVVYNDLETTGLPRDVFAPADRQIVVKMNYLLQR